jgi:adenylate kinase
VQNKHDSREWLEDQNAYVLFDSMMKELIKKQPKDPITHMLQYLQAGVPQSGPLCIVISRPPGAAMGRYGKGLATSLGLELVSAGDLLREKGFTCEKVGLADDTQVSELVIAKVKEAGVRHKGIVLDGFPRTPAQTTFLKEHRIVPTHVLVLVADEGKLKEMQDNLAMVGGEAVALKMGAYLRHAAVALEVYKDITTVINVSNVSEDDLAIQAMAKVAKLAPLSKGPTLPPRVVILAAKGTEMAFEHARGLAQRLGAVFVDAMALQSWIAQPLAERSRIMLDIPDIDALSSKDPLGVVGARLRQPDCTKYGWVLLGFPLGDETASRMNQDGALRPLRVISYPAAEEDQAFQFAQQSSVNILGASKSSKVLEVRLDDGKAAEDIFDEIAGFAERCLGQ